MSQLPPLPPGATLDNQTSGLPPLPPGAVLDTETAPIALPEPPPGATLDQASVFGAAQRRFDQIAGEYEPPGEEARQSFIDQRWDTYLEGLALANAQRAGHQSERGTAERLLTPLAEGTINLGRGIAGLLGAEPGEAADFRERDYEGLNLGPGAYSRFSQEHGEIFDRQFSAEAEYSRRRQSLGKTLFDNLRRQQPEANDHELYRQVHTELARLGYQPNVAGQLGAVTGTPDEAPEFARSLVGEVAAGIARGYGRVSTGGAGVILGTLAAVEGAITGRGPEEGYGYFENLDASTSNFHADFQHSLRSSDVAQEFNPGSARWWVANASEQGTLMASFIANPAFGTAVVGLAESSSYHDLKGALVDRGYTEDEARIRALGGAAQIGVTNALLDRVGFGAISGAARQGLKKGMSAWVGKWLLAGITEGATEAIQEFNQTLTQYGINADDPDFGDIKQIIAAGGTGALMGMLFGGIGQTASNVLGRTEQDVGADAAVVSSEALDAEFQARMEQAGLTQPPAKERESTEGLPRQPEDPNTDPTGGTDPGPQIDNADPNQPTEQAPETPPGVSQNPGVESTVETGQAIPAAPPNPPTDAGPLQGVVQPPQQPLEAEADLDPLRGVVHPPAPQEAAPGVLTPGQEYTAEQVMEFAGTLEQDASPIAAMIGDGPFVVADVPVESVDPGILQEGDTDQAKLARAQEGLAAGTPAPPIIAADAGGGQLFVADGSHRVLAAQAAGQPTIQAVIPKATAEAMGIDPGAAAPAPVQLTTEQQIAEGEQAIRQSDETIARVERLLGAEQAGIFGQEVASADLPGPSRQPKTGPPKKRSKADVQDEKIRRKFSKTESGELFDAPDPIRERGERAWTDDAGKTVTVAPLPPSRVESEIRRTPVPEMVRLAKKLLGRSPIVNARLKTSLGIFRYDNSEGRIEINPSLGKSPQALAKTLAHEIGHAIDWLPDKNLNRGNILGRLRSLDGHLKKTLGGLSEESVRTELYALSQKWRGEVNEATDPAGYVAYRKSSKELYADFLSVVLNDPAMARREARKAFDAFIEGMNGKIEVAQAYLSMQDLLNGHSEDVIAARRADVREGYDEFKTAAAIRHAEREQNKEDIRSLLLQSMVDFHNPNMKLQGDLAKAGIRPVTDENNLDFAGDEYAIVDQESALTLGRVDDALEGALEAGVSLEDIGLFIQMKRIIARDRDGIINPGGLSEVDAQEQIDDLLNILGTEKAAALQDSSSKFLDLPYQMAVKLHKEGAYSDETMGEIRKNRGSYATFVTIEHADTGVGPGIHKQVGTFSQVGNPLINTLAKMIGQARLYESQRYRNATVPAQKQAGELVKIKAAPGSTPRSREKGKKTFAHLEKGKLVWYEADASYVRAIERKTISELGMILGFLDTVTYGVFHKVYVQLSVAWMLRNIPRDFMRTYRNLKGVTTQRGRKSVGFIELVVAYYKSLPDSVMRELGVRSEDVKRLEESRALAAIKADDLLGVKRDGDYERLLLKKFGSLESAQPALKKMASKLFQGLILVGNTTETMSKLAGDKVLMRRDIPERERAHIIRNYVGTPNRYRAGTITSINNRLFMYSKIIINGWKSDGKLATSKDTRLGWWMGHMVTSGIPKLLMYAAVAGWLGEELEEWFSKVPDYDRLNYTIVPLGIDADGKAVYMRIPMDHNDLLVSGTMWHLADTLRRENPHGIEADVTEMFRLLGSQVPSWSPPFKIAGAWAEYAMGGNPYDSWRRRGILSSDEQGARGLYAANGMIQWTADQFGIVSDILDVVPYFGGSEESQSPRWANIPGISSFVRRSDRGVDQERWSLEEVEYQEAARFRLSLPDNVKPLLQERNRLQRFGTGREQSDLSVEERRRRNQLNAYYRDYLKLTAAIKAAEDRGETERATHLRDRLRAVSERYTEK